MTLNTLMPSLLAISLLSSMSLLGCQTNNLTRTAQTSATINDKNWSATTLKPRLFQTATNYEWQLTHISDDKGLIKPFNQKLPLTMEVHPDFLTFTEGCQTQDVYFSMWLPLPYPYTYPDLRDLSHNCTVVDHANIRSKNYKSGIQGDAERVLNSTFISHTRYADVAFRFDPITPMSAQFSNQTFKQLALKTSAGKTLIFSGIPKPEHSMAGIPITNELLERYKWRLIRATDKTGKAIRGLIRADIPIIATYQLDIYDQSDNEPEQDYQQGAYGQSVRVSGGCNGIGGPYALSTSQTLLTGGFPSTMVSCDDTIDDVETRFRRMMLYSASQLTLGHLENYPLSGSVNELNEQKPSYLLTQKLESGETLIWKNEPKKTP